jgi:Transcription factor WhiB
MHEAVETGVGIVPVVARGQWLALTRVLEELPPVPCQTGDKEAWWPDKRDLDSPATQGAVAGCRRCPAEGACLAYALAADERFGVWGGTLPEDRRRTRELVDSRLAAAD